jgi:hypothetical protein
MPKLDASDLNGSWHGLEQKALRQLGEVLLPTAALDPSLRAKIDLSVLDKLVAVQNNRDAL